MLKIAKVPLQISFKHSKSFLTFLVNLRLETKWAVLMAAWLWGVSSVPFGIPFRLPVLFYNRSYSTEEDEPPKTQT